MMANGYEADPRHAELLAKPLNLENCKFVVTPGAKLPFDYNSGPDEDEVDKDEDTQMANSIQSRCGHDACPDAI